MADRFEEIIKNLPDEPSKKIGEKTWMEIVRSELISLWEKRASLILATLSFFFGLLTLIQTIKMMKLLDTAGFWQLVSNDTDWLINNFSEVKLAFFEANPIQEVVSFLLLLAFFIFSMYFLFRKQKGGRKMENKYTTLLPIIIVLIILTSIGGYALLNNKSDIFNQIETGTSLPSTATQPPNQEVANTDTPSPRPTERIVPGQFFLSVDSPAEGQIFSSPTILVKGRTLAGAEVWVNDKQVKVDSLGNFNLTTTLEEGENYLLITAGNENADAEMERTVYYER